MPLPHSTSTVASGYGPGSKSSTTKRSTCTRRGSRSTSTPARASWWSRRPPTFTADTIGGSCSRSPTKRGDRVFDVVARQRHRLLLDDLARRVERARRDAEHDPPAVRLARLLEKSQQPRRAPEADEQHAGGVGIERARMTDAALRVGLAQPGDDVVGRAARRLVDDDEAVFIDRPRRCLTTTRSRAVPRARRAGTRRGRRGRARTRSPRRTGGRRRRGRRRSRSRRRHPANAGSRGRCRRALPSATQVTSASVVRRRMSMSPSTSSRVTP